MFNKSFLVKLAALLVVLGLLYLQAQVSTFVMLPVVVVALIAWLFASWKWDAVVTDIAYVLVAAVSFYFLAGTVWAVVGVFGFAVFDGLFDRGLKKLGA